MKTNKVHFKIFKDECKKWLEYWGLTEWKVYYSHKNWNDDALASCSSDIKAMVATINLEPDWSSTMDDEDIELCLRQTAFHEVCEVFLSKFRDVAKRRDNTWDEIIHNNHEIIRRLENCVFDRSPMPKRVLKTKTVKTAPIKQKKKKTKKR